MYGHDAVCDVHERDGFGSQPLPKVMQGVSPDLMTSHRALMRMGRVSDDAFAAFTVMYVDPYDCPHADPTHARLRCGESWYSCGTVVGSTSCMNMGSPVPQRRLRGVGRSNAGKGARVRKARTMQGPRRRETTHPRADASSANMMSPRIRNDKISGDFGGRWTRARVLPSLN